ncbi:MAG: hypothetical protein JKY81_08070 [Colwellia sp.]|nr:hypothetical protein [Colwellia sp.]
MKIIKQRATIVSIDDLNKYFEVKIADYPKDSFTLTLEGDEGDNVLLPLAKGKLSNYFEIGDEVEIRKIDESDFEIINFTCKVLKLSRFKRDFISILKRLDNDAHPMKRCVLLYESGFVIFSTKNNPDKIRLITEAIRN